MVLGVFSVLGFSCLFLFGFGGSLWLSVVLNGCCLILVLLVGVGGCCYLLVEVGHC